MMICSEKQGTFLVYLFITDYETEVFTPRCVSLSVLLGSSILLPMEMEIMLFIKALINCLITH